MDQPSALNFEMDSSAVPTPSNGMSSPTPPSPEPLADTSRPLPETAASSVPRQHPIPPASEPMQYRAIGLIEGVYTPSDEQFTRGNLVTGDGTLIDAVLLGRVLSLVKKHIDLEKPHLWVVYPRTREKGNDLHAQIVGIWEPESLSKEMLDGEDLEETSEDGELSAQDVDEESAPPPKLVAIPPKPPTAPEEVRDPIDGYFSVRGEILFYSPENQGLIVRIQQSPKKKDKPPKAFKLNLNGELEGKTVGYFWELHAQREGNVLVVQEGKMIGLVPPRKRKGRPEAPGGRKRPPMGRKPTRKKFATDGAAPGPARDAAPREAPSRPIKRANRPPKEQPQGE